ncbi:MAG TPA: hypothetical protein VFN68_03225 [Acidimicrobiales bacterium]|nr:hypothetical protein [Acidimicrobiales bacterium]
MDLESVVEELYGLDPAEFTSTRDERARQARQAGDRGLAGGIKALKRPSTAAWAVNLLARHRRADLQQLLGLGEQLRAAQASLDGDELRALGRRRHQVVAGMAGQARTLAQDRGVRVSDAVEREVIDTLEAALADPAAGAAAGSGRLVRSLTHTGLDEVDLDGAVPGSPPAPVGTSGRPGVGTGPASAEAEAAARTEAEVAAAEVAAAEADADRAAETVERIRGRLDRAAEAHHAATGRARDAAEAVRHLEQQIDDARRLADRAEADARAAAVEAERVRAELSATERAAERAEERVRSLRRRAGR